jgi:allantoicase
VVDTAFFTGNYPPAVSVDATWLAGNPSNEELAAAQWITVVPRSAALGDTANTYQVQDQSAFSHVRLNIFPDGGVARLRVRGTPVPDPRTLGSRVDLAALHNGGEIAECSNMFYSDARQVLYPGVARSMSEGWETARRRTVGNDYLVVTLAGPSLLSWVDIDTGFFLGNAPGRVRLSGSADEESPWKEILPESPVSPDGHNKFRVRTSEAISAVRVDVFPDGGFSRLHLMGELAPAALAEAIAHWLRLLPSDAFARVLAGAGIDGVPVGQLTAEQLIGLAW